MTERSKFLAYLELQGSEELITKSDLIAYARDHGESISDRNISYYTAQRILPQAVRAGSRAGVYPGIVGQLLVWVLRSRKFGFSIDAIRDLLPVWELLVSARRDGTVDIAELEVVARQRVQSMEANLGIPWLVNELFFEHLCQDCRGDMTWVAKDGTVLTGSDDVAIQFELNELNPATGKARRVAWTQLVLPGLAQPAGRGPTTVILGIGVDVEPDTAWAEVAAPTTARRPHHREAAIPIQEVATIS